MNLLPTPNPTTVDIGANIKYIEKQIRTQIGNKGTEKRVMKKLIYADDAIEAVDKGCLEWRGIYARCEENINAIPAVDLREMWDEGIGMFIADYPERGKVHFVGDDTFKAVILHPDDYVEPQKGEWIPTSERLPSEDGDYLVTLENGFVKILGYSTEQSIRYPKGFYYTKEGFSWRQNMNPAIAWMPLPESYKECE